MAFLIVYVTHESEAEALRVAQEMLQARLCACANIFPIRSLYWWQGVLESGQEWVSILKTRHSHWAALRAAIEQTHPYDTPCIMKIEVSANEKYECWIEAQLAALE